MVERMVSDVADVDRLDAMPRLLRICATRTADELNVRDVAGDLGLPYRTVGSYLTHLQTVFLLHLLPAWSRNLTSFAGGVVAYTGDRAVPFGERLAAIPLSNLWETR